MRRSTPHFYTITKTIMAFLLDGRTDVLYVSVRRKPEELRIHTVHSLLRGMVHETDHFTFPNDRFG